MASPLLTVQTASLYASGVDSTFTGDGGPYGFSPFTGEFGGIVTSAGIAADPFNDTVYDVAQGDIVTFVIAVQNTGTAPAYHVSVADALPAGFEVPPGGLNLTVTDGTNTDLATTGNLFTPQGLTIQSPLAAYSASSGLNVALISFDLQASSNLPGPYSTVQDLGSVVGYTDSPSGGANLALANPASAATSVVTAAPVPVVTPESDPSAVAKGQTVAFDVSLALPTGSMQQLEISPVLPSGSATLDLVSATVTHVGANLSMGTPSVLSNGSIAFGTVVDSGASGLAAANTITERLVVRADGTASGTAALDVAVSALNANAPNGVWSATVASAVGVIVPPAAPMLSGLWTGQNATTTMVIRPFAELGIADANLAQTGTLAITLGDATLGKLSTNEYGSIDAAGDTFYLTGSLSALQTAAQDLMFTPSTTGTETFDISLEDATGGIVQDSSSQVTIAPSVGAAIHFASSPTAEFLTSTANGQQTMMEGETYGGPVSYLTSQYIYDGSAPVVIVAESANVFIENIVGAAAIEVQSGQNVISAGTGSNFILGGSGTDTFFLDARNPAVTWDTIVGFHPGDVATVWGFTSGTSDDWWGGISGAPGYTGSTLRFSIDGSGSITDSITFAGATNSDTAKYALTTGMVGGINYMTIFAE